MVRSTVGEVLVPARQATEDRSSGYDVLHQNSILNEWFERGSYLCLKSRLSFTKDFRRRIGPGQSTSDQVRNRDLTLFGDRCLAEDSKGRARKPFHLINPISPFFWSRCPRTAHFLIGLYPSGFRCLGACGSANQDAPGVGTQNPLKHRQGRVTFQPMKCTANGDDIVGLGRWEFFDSTVDQGECNSLFRHRSLRRSDHSCFWVESSAASNKRSEADGKQSGSAAIVKQGFVAAQRNLLRDF